MTTTEKTTYRGLADAYGVETFCPAENAPPWLVIRASMNRQRHAVVFEVDITDADLDRITLKLGDQDWAGALEEIKKTDGGVRVEAGCEASFLMIPNPALDPWRARK